MIQKFRCLNTESSAKITNCVKLFPLPFTSELDEFFEEIFRNHIVHTCHA